MRMKREVMWAEIQKIVCKLDGYEGQALAQLCDEFKDCNNELCLKCGKYKDAHRGACNGCRWIIK